MKIPRGQTFERRAYMKAYNATHPPRDRREYKAAYDAAHKADIAAYCEANADKLKARAAAYYRAKRESILARVKAYYQSDANKGRLLEYQHAYNRANPDRIKPRQSAYRKANPERKQHLENKRRARKAANGGSHTLQELIDKFGSLGSVCFYCKKAGKLSVDHDIPLSRGGGDSIDNILPACRSCNSRKHNKTAQEFLDYLAHVSKETDNPAAPLVG